MTVLQLVEIIGLMKKSINAKKVLKKVREEKSDRQKVTVYLSKSKYDEFKAVCENEGLATSKVFEEIISSFLESNRKK